MRQAAARNNAELCHAVCRTHGLEGQFSTMAWTSATRTPPLYPDAVTLRPSAAVERVLERIDTSRGCSVKDSYADLDLSGAGFDVLFDAQWIRRAPGLPSPASAAGEHWKVVRDPETLNDWDVAGHGEPLGRFRPALLADPDVEVLAARRDGRIVAGAVLNGSGAVVGLSNVFSVAERSDGAWAGAVAAAVADHPERPIVGYEQGEDLAAALRHGFEVIGPLRVWLRAG